MPNFAIQYDIILTTHEFIEAALREDINSGDHSTEACITSGARGVAVLKVKDNGIIAGIGLAQEIIRFLEPEAEFTLYFNDGDQVVKGNIAFEVRASIRTILKAERLLLNCMQRMSGIATLTKQYVEKVSNYGVKILDTRKTTPLFRSFEKQAVVLGGGVNHRMGLYDMIMLKDNHIDFCGGIEKAIILADEYIKTHDLNIEIEVETRTIEDVKRVLAVGRVHRIMLDNYDPYELSKAVQLIDYRYITEASGGIMLDNIISYAATGVDCISVGAITHHAVSMDLSLKAKIV